MQQAGGFPHKSFSASLPQPSNDRFLSVESPSGIQECGCSFLSLTLPQSPAQAAEKAEPLPLSRMALCVHSAPSSGTPCHTHFTLEHLRVPPFKGCPCLPDSTKAGQPEVGHSAPLSIPLSGPPALQTGSSCLLLLSFSIERSEPSKADVYSEVKDERLVLHLWSH